MVAFRWHLSAVVSGVGRRPPDARGGRAELFRQTTSYVGVGVIATSIHYLVLVVAVQLFGVHPVPAALLGYCLGGVLSYSLNRRHTFVSERPHHEATWRFAAVAGVGFVLTFLLMGVLVDRWSVPYLAAQVATTLIVMVWTFTVNRIWTFAADR